MIAAVFTVILGTLFATMLGRSVTRSARSLTAAAERAAAGDLTVRAPADGAEEFRRLADELNRMTASLGDLVGEIRTSSGDLSAAAQQISATAEEADHSTDGIARAMDDVAGAAERQVALISSASLAASGARDVADEGRAQSTRASEAMEHVRDASQQVTEVISELGQKSGQIGGIVSTITGLAKQTNLLALNAAIEAARAGDQGRGFAVVAEEVRKLAEESQRAAGSIAELITEIQGATKRAVEATAEGDRRIQGGAETVEQSRDAFERIAESAVDVNSALGEVDLDGGVDQRRHRAGRRLHAGDVDLDAPGGAGCRRPRADRGAPRRARPALPRVAACGRRAVPLSGASSSAAWRPAHGPSRNGEFP